MSTAKTTNSRKATGKKRKVMKLHPTKHKAAFKKAVKDSHPHVSDAEADAGFESFLEALAAQQDANDIGDVGDEVDPVGDVPMDSDPELNRDAA